MKRSIVLRIFLVTALLSVLAVAVFAAYSVRAVRGAAFTGLTEGLQRVAETAKAAIESHASVVGAPLKTLVASMAREAGVRLTVIDADGVVLSDSEQDPGLMENHKLRPEVAEALSGEIGISMRKSGTLGHDMVYVAVPSERDGMVWGTVRASYSGERFTRAAALLRRDSLGFAAVLLLLCALAAFAVSRYLAAPLRELSETVTRFSSGNFAARLLLKRRDEIGGLADAFNSMAERVQTLIRDLTRRTEELDGVFASVGQGIALLDDGDKIVRSNRMFEEFVGQYGLEGKALWEVAHALPLLELSKKVRSVGPQPPEEARMGGHVLLCSVARLAAGGGTIALLYDVTDAKRVEEVKRDFVVNASHELRTPLTAVRGFLEMLEGEVKGDAARWVEVARRNTDRMKAIVEDLLKLSRLEAGGVELSRQKADVAAIVSETVELFTPRAREKGLSLTAIPGDPPPIDADPYLLEQMLANLVENAIRYTEKGGVTVRCEKEGPRLLIAVEDTGIGIAEEHRSRIFERFYVVDKSRSRTQGGTGLGLSIVKHIVQLHGGTVEVESAVGKGSRFIVRLPVLTEN
jgi:two-component system phosphate regulon sensor histidine kinase PhoR